MKKTVLPLIFLIIGGVAGIFISGWWGGFLTGFCLFLSIVLFIGRPMAQKATARIDKLLKDFKEQNPEILI